MIVILLALFFLSYGKEIFGSFDKISFISAANKIQGILEQPQIYLEKQLQIKGEVYSANGKYYAKDEQGYKIELQGCTDDRDLVIGESKRMSNLTMPEGIRSLDSAKEVIAVVAKR